MGLFFEKIFKKKYTYRYVCVCVFVIFKTLCGPNKIFYICIYNSYIHLLLDMKGRLMACQLWFIELDALMLSGL